MGLEEHKQHTFDAYCKTLLKNETVNIRIEYAKLSKRETTFSALTPKEQTQLQYLDHYAPGRHTFQILDTAIEVEDAELVEALTALSKERRTIILLSYLFGMTDLEIARQLHLNQSTVQKRRLSILKEMRQLMEGFTHEQ